MNKSYYYLPNLFIVFNIHNGANVSTLLNKKIKGKGVLNFKDNYKHNFWTEIRGGKKIDSFEVFKTKYTYLDN
jgi:acyl-CoA-binding protein